jgi:predicted nuclease with TOPRIM domain
MTYDDLEVTYRNLLIEHDQVCWALEKQKRSISQLVAENNTLPGKLSEVHTEVTRLNSQMNELKKRVSQLNPGIDLLEKILEGVPTLHLKSVGFDHKLLSKLQYSQDTKFSPAEEVLDPYTGKQMPQHHTQHPVTSPIPKSF